MQFRSVYIVVSLLLVSSLACHTKRGIIHHVQPGDTLIKVSHVYAVDMEELLAANRLENPNVLQPGDKLLIPGAEKEQRVSTNLWEREDVSAVTKAKKSDKSLAARPGGRPTYAKRKTGGQLSFSWPAEGQVISKYGMRNQKMHNGIDLRVKPGVPIHPVAPGAVVYKGKGIKGYGNLVIVRHSSGLFSVYAYLDDIAVKKGSSVARDTVLGNARDDRSESFIHFELRKGKQALDPLRMLPKK